MARFRNEFRDLYDGAFPWVKKKKSEKDEQKPWLDDDEFKILLEEKGELYSKKVKGKLDPAGTERLAALCKEVNRARQRLKSLF